MEADGTLSRICQSAKESDVLWQIGRDGLPTGLHKISGQAVEAVLGGIFRQYVRPLPTSSSSVLTVWLQGAAMALRVFNSRILPFLPLPQELRNPALQLARLHGDLTMDANTSQEIFAREESIPSFDARQAALKANLPAGTASWGDNLSLRTAKDIPGSSVPSTSVSLS